MFKKEAIFMEIAVALREDEMQKVVAMQKYVSEKKSQAKHTPELAKKDAQKALKRTGVVSKKGTLKKVIVSWE